MIVQTHKSLYWVSLERKDDYSSRYAVVKEKRLFLGFIVWWKEVYKMAVTDWEVYTPWDREMTFTLACLAYEKHMADSLTGVQRP